MVGEAVNCDFAISLNLYDADDSSGRNNLVKRQMKSHDQVKRGIRYLSDQPKIQAPGGETILVKKLSKLLTKLCKRKT